MRTHLGVNSKRVAIALVVAVNLTIPTWAARDGDGAAAAIGRASASSSQPAVNPRETAKERNPRAQQATGATPDTAEGGLPTATATTAEQAASSPGATPPVSPQDRNKQNPARFSPAGELNNHLPSWLRFDGQYQARLEDGSTGNLFRSSGGDAYFLNRIRLGVTIQPTGWLRFHVEGQDVRAFDKNPPRTSGFYDLFDVRQAYMEVGNTEKGALAVRAGRQIFYWGEGRLMADSRWSLPGRSFDGVRMTLRHNGYRLDAFAASVVQITPATNSGFSEPQFGNNIHGLYGGIEKLVPKAVIEPYVFWRIGARVTGEDKKAGDLNFKAFGFRWNGKLPEGFDYAAEMVDERGKVADSDFNAWAGHWVLGRTWKGAWKPRVYAEYNYATGDNDPTDNKVQTFDVMYPSTHVKWGETDQVGWRNIHDVRGSFEVAPGKDWTASTNYHSYWLANTHDGLYAANGSVVIPRVVAGTAGRWVGQEADVQGSHKFANGIEVGAGVGHIFPGTFIKRASPGHGYTYPYGMMTYTF